MTGRRGLERIEVDNFEPVLDRGIRRCGCQFENIGAAGHKRLVAQPDKASGETIRDRRSRAHFRDDVASRSSDLDGKYPRDGLARNRMAEIAIGGDDPLDLSPPSGRQDLYRRPGMELAARNQPAISSEIRIWTVHPLHRHPERSGGAPAHDFDLFEIFEQSWPAVPAHALRAGNDVVTAAGRDRDEDDF